MSALDLEIEFRLGGCLLYIEQLDKRPITGLESTSARKIHLYHQWWIKFLDGWAERTKEAILLPWADRVTRLTWLFIRVMGDQLEGNKYTGEPCLCHCCYAQSQS